MPDKMSSLSKMGRFVSRQSHGHTGAFCDVNTKNVPIIVRLLKKKSSIEKSKQMSREYSKEVLNLLWDGQRTYGLLAILWQRVKFGSFYIFAIFASYEKKKNKNTFS